MIEKKKATMAEKKKKVNLVILTEEPIHSYLPGRKKTSQRMMPDILARAYATALDHHYESLSDPGFKKAVEEKRALPPLHHRLDITIADIRSITPENKLDIREGIVLVPEQGKNGKWGVKWVKKKFSEPHFPDVILNRIPTIKYEKLLKGMDEQMKIPMLNPLQYSDLTRSKKSSYDVMVKHGVPTPFSKFVSTKKEALAAIDEIKTDRIFIKPEVAEAARGAGAYHKSELKELIRKGEFNINEPYVFQDYMGDEALENNWRVFAFTRLDPKTNDVIANVTGGVRREGPFGSILQGAKAIDIDLTKNPELSQITKKAAVAFAKESNSEPQLMGVDIVKDKESYSVLEVNSFPGAINAMEEINPRYAHHLANAIIAAALEVKNKPNLWKKN